MITGTTVHVAERPGAEEEIVLIETGKLRARRIELFAEKQKGLITYDYGTALTDTCLPYIGAGLVLTRGDEKLLPLGEHMGN